MRGGHHWDVTWLTFTRRAPAVALIIVLAACGGDTSRPSEVEPSGPPSVRPDVVQDHAAQFDDELSDRQAGSQQEQAASQYVLGHLQQAGYFVQLDAVPVGDLVESTNLVALPPSGKDPETIITVAYDSPGESAASGAAVGTFLELARALYAADPDHRVEFVALGAETSAEHLGSRRLAQQLRESGSTVSVVTIAPGGESLGVVGALAAGIERAAEQEGIEIGEPPRPEDYGGVDVFAEAGFDSAVVSGPPDDLGSVLIAWLVQD